MVTATLKDREILLLVIFPVILTGEAAVKMWKHVSAGRFRSTSQAAEAIDCLDSLVRDQLPQRLYDAEVLG